MANKSHDLVEKWIRQGVRLAAEMKKQGVYMHMAITFGPLPKKQRGRHAPEKKAE
jgi:hypothetical protein